MFGRKQREIERLNRIIGEKDKEIKNYESKLFSEQMSNLWLMRTSNEKSLQLLKHKKQETKDGVWCKDCAHDLGTVCAVSVPCGKFERKLP